jgi:hypothetical protein
MTDAVLNTVITTIGSTVTSCIGLLIVVLVRKTNDTTRQTHDLVNSRMTEMLKIKDEIMEIAVEASKQAGIKQQKESDDRKG